MLKILAISFHFNYALTHIKKGHYYGLYFTTSIYRYYL